MTPAAGVPRTAWQAPQPEPMNSSCPRRSVSPAGAVAGFASFASQASNSSAGIAITCNAISACGPPQYSAHGPRNTPGRVACTRSRVSRPGIMSTLPPRLGTQKLWITSADCSVKTTSRPTGMRISLAAATVDTPGVIGDAPPPLLADDLDRHDVRLVGRAGERIQQAEVGGEQGGQHDSGKHDAADDHRARRCQRAADFRRAADREHCGDGDDQEDRDAPDEKNPRQPQDLVGLEGVGRERCNVFLASGQQQARQRDEGSARAHRRPAPPSVRSAANQAETASICSSLSRRAIGAMMASFGLGEVRPFFQSRSRLAM